MPVSFELSFLDATEWGYRRSEMNFVDGYMYIQPIEYRNDDKLSCKLISPARILQWFMSGMDNGTLSIRNHNFLTFL